MANTFDTSAAPPVAAAAPDASESTQQVEKQVPVSKIGNKNPSSSSSAEPSQDKSAEPAGKQTDKDKPPKKAMPPKPWLKKKSVPSTPSTPVEESTVEAAEIVETTVKAPASKPWLEKKSTADASSSSGELKANESESVEIGASVPSKPWQKKKRSAPPVVPVDEPEVAPEVIEPVAAKGAYNLDFLDQMDDANFNPFQTKSRVVCDESVSAAVTASPQAVTASPVAATASSAAATALPAAVTASPAAEKASPAAVTASPVLATASPTAAPVIKAADALEGKQIIFGIIEKIEVLYQF